MNNYEDVNTLPPLDLDYVRSIATSALELERVQKVLPLVPKELVNLLIKESDDFLFGVVSMGQALHDLMGADILVQVGELLAQHEDNKIAVGIASEAVKMIAIMEAIGYLSCKELTDRDDEQQE